MIYILSLALALSAFTVVANRVQLIWGKEAFGISLYNSIAQKENGKNILFSPLSAHAVLSLAYQGAEGRTADSLKRVLNLKDTRSAANDYKQILSSLSGVENATLYVANKAYVKTGYKLRTIFQYVARYFFLSDVEQVDFAYPQAAADTINFWVEQKTNNNIKDLVSKNTLDENTRLVLVNAIYFKGKWLHPFSGWSTKQKPFYLNKQDNVYVDTMHITETFNFEDSQILDAKVLELPYQNSDLSFLIILPNEKDGLSALEEKLSHHTLGVLGTDLKPSPQYVQVSLPKFKIETSTDLKEVLSSLGLDIIFSDLADFTGFLEIPTDLKVSNVIQKAFIDVNEVGTEAAAATEVNFGIKSSLGDYKPLPLDFKADHPFVFVLNSKKFGALFSGRLLKP